MLQRRQRVVEQGGNASRSRRVRWSKFVVLILAASIIVALVAWPSLKTHLQAIAVLRQVSGQPVPWIIRRTVTEPIRVEAVVFQTEAGSVRGRLYLPVHHPNAPGLVVLHGVHHLGMDEPRLVNFATAMARCGLRVLTPQLPGIADYHVDRSSMQVIGDSARWFSGRTGGQVGVLGLSFSGGLALVAASEPAYQPYFKFVFTVGSQDAMDHVANYYLTGKEVRPDGTVERLKPHEYGPLVLEYEHLEDFVPAEDESAIRPVLREHLYENKSAEALAESKLNARQKTEVTELMDSSSAATKVLLAASDAKHLAEMKELSPEGKLRTMTTPVYLLHGQADNIIPAAETLWTAKELPKGILKEELISPVLSHLDLEATPGVMDQWRLVHFFALVLHAAERK